MTQYSTERSWNLHNRGYHADIHHDPPNGYPNPVLAEVHGESIGEETACHASCREPDAVEAEIRSPG